MAAGDLTTTDTTDFSAMYRDDAAPKDVTPQEELFGQLSQYRASAAASAVSGAGQAVQPAKQPNPSSTAEHADASAGLVARLKPLGITSVGALKGKTDAELHKLSGDVVTYELRQQSLAKYFAKNPDGSWNFMLGPDGNPTGLDATGKTLPPGGAQPAAGAPGAKPAPKPAAKPVATKKRPTATVHKPAARRPAPHRIARPTRTTARRPAPRRVTRPAPRPVPATRPATGPTRV